MRNILFAGSECAPFVKTGGLADVMEALPKALVKSDCDVRVFLPKYACIKQEYKDKMEYVTSFYMNIGYVPRTYYVGLLKLCMNGVTFYFIDNEELFSDGNPYTEMSNDIQKYVYFCKAVLSSLPLIDFYPDIIHCHDWQAALIPIYLRTEFREQPNLKNAKSIMTIHNLKFQGITNEGTMRYLTGFPDYVFYDEKMGQNGIDANMLKGGIVFADKITTVSGVYAEEIKTREYGEGLDGMIAFHHMKLSGIVNGIDFDIYNPETDNKIEFNYSYKNCIEGKKQNKLAIQKELGLTIDENKMVICLISRLTDQKGLDILLPIVDSIMDDNTEVIILGTGEYRYEDGFRYFENKYKGRFSANIMYSEARARKIYAGSDLMLVPSRFEPCGLTQLISFRYGTIPLVRETGGLKETVIPYNEYEKTGDGFSFDRYDCDAFLSTLNYAKTIYFTKRKEWDKLVKADMKKNNSWDESAKKYIDLYDSMK